MWNACCNCACLRSRLWSWSNVRTRMIWWSIALEGLYFQSWLKCRSSQDCIIINVYWCCPCTLFFEGFQDNVETVSFTFSRRLLSRLKIVLFVGWIAFNADGGRSDVSQDYIVQSRHINTASVLIVLFLWELLPLCWKEQKFNLPAQWNVNTSAANVVWSRK
jgi:hypothetical protein